MTKTLIQRCLSMKDSDLDADGDLLDQLIALRDKGVPFVLTAAIPSAIHEEGGNDDDPSFAVQIAGGFVNTLRTELQEIAENKDNTPANRSLAFIMMATDRCNLATSGALNKASATKNKEVFSAIAETVSDLLEYVHEDDDVSHDKKETLH